MGKKNNANKQANNKNSKAGQSQEQRRQRNEDKRKERKERSKKTWAAEAADLLTFGAQLAPYGLELRDVKGDGNCLFRAIGDQLSGDSNGTHGRLRADIVNYIRQHRDDFEPFLEAEDENETFDDYVYDLSKDGVYAGNWALVAASRLLRVNIYIHQINQPIWTILYDEQEDQTYSNHSRRQTKLGSLHVAYYGWEHYSSLRRVGGPYDGPANIELPDVLPEIPCRAGEESAKDNRDDNHLTFNEAQMMACSTSKDIDLIREILSATNNNLNNAMDELLNMQAEEEQNLQATVETLSLADSSKPLSPADSLLEPSSLDSSSSASAASGITPVEVDGTEETLAIMNAVAMIDAVHSEEATGNPIASTDKTKKASKSDKSGKQQQQAGVSKQAARKNKKKGKSKQDDPPLPPPSQGKEGPTMARSTIHI